MVNIHSNNKDGSITATGVQQPDSTTNITNLSATETVETIDSSLLPAGQHAIGQINYFGSSFSGADIRVYANIYNDKTSIDAIIPQLEQEREYAREVVKATGIVKSLTVGLTSNATTSPRNQFLQRIGLSNPTTEAQQQAAQFMVGQFLNDFLSITTTLTTKSQITTKADAIINQMQSIADQLTNQINALKTNQNIGGSLFSLGTLQTLSVQSHREKFGVRSLGRSYVKGYTRGPRTIAGSMIFTVFHEHAFAALMRRMSLVEKNPEISFLLPDQLPPLDLTILFANEYGQQSEFRVYGLEILNDGVTYSIEDLLTENVMQFVCRDVDPLKSRGRVVLDRQARNAEVASQEIAASSLYRMNDEYTSYLDRLHVRRRLLNR